MQTYLHNYKQKESFQFASFKPVTVCKSIKVPLGLSKEFTKKYQTWFCAAFVILRSKRFRWRFCLRFYKF